MLHEAPILLSACSSGCRSDYIICTRPLFISSLAPSSQLMSVSLDTVSLSPCLSANSCSLLILSTPHPSTPPSPLPLAISWLSVLWLYASAHHYTFYLNSPPPQDFPGLFLLSLSTSLPLVSPCSPGKSSFPASPSLPPPPHLSRQPWSGAM